MILLTRPVTAYPCRKLWVMLVATAHPRTEPGHRDFVAIHKRGTRCTIYECAQSGLQCGLVVHAGGLRSKMLNL